MLLMDNNLQILKKVELEIVKEIHDVCEKNSLRYTLAFGSMIGAVRHKGFIPWDDDIDIVMPYEDYVKFKNVESKKLSDKYELVDSEKHPKYRLPFMKVQKKNTYAVSSLSILKKDSPCGIYVDIFPAMYIPRNKALKSFINIANSFLGAINSAGRIQRVAHTHKGILGSIALFFLFLVNKITSPRLNNKLMYKIALLATRDNSDNMYTANFNSPGIMNRYVMKKDVFEERVLMDFEDSKLWMPKDYDEIMTRYYGNYMQLPPENKRDTHSFNFVCENTMK